MTYNYEQSIWGDGIASTRWSSPTSFRLRQALSAIMGLGSGSVIVEVGSGAGQFIRAIKKARPELVCHGSDISATAITIAKKFNDQAIYTHHTPERLPYEDASVDAVLIFEVLEHVDSPQALLREVRRVLKPGGILYAFVPCEGDWLSLWHLLEVLHLKYNLTKKFAGHIQYFSRRALVQLISERRFTITRIRYSEHLFGQLLGVAAFWLMERGAKQRGEVQLNNEQYLATVAQGTAGTIFRKLVNTIVYLESTLLCHLPSPNVHVTVEKK